MQVFALTRKTMARPLRLGFAGALDHVTSRSNERHSIFLGVLAQTCERFNGICHAYGLMP
jgi:hypothetical protein